MPCAGGFWLGFHEDVSAFFAAFCSFGRQWRGHRPQLVDEAGVWVSASGTGLEMPLRQRGGVDESAGGDGEEFGLG